MSNIMGLINVRAGQKTIDTFDNKNAEIFLYVFRKLPLLYYCIYVHKTIVTMK